MVFVRILILTLIASASTDKKADLEKRESAEIVVNQTSLEPGVKSTLTLDEYLGGKYVIRINTTDDLCEETVSKSSRLSSETPAVTLPTATPRGLPPGIFPEATQEIEHSTKKPSISMTPDEQIKKVVSDLRRTLNNKTSLADIRSVQESIKQVSDVLKLDPRYAIPPDVVRLVDKLASEMVLGKKSKAIVVAPKIAVAAVANSDPTRALVGVRVPTSKNDKFTNASIILIWADDKISDKDISMGDLLVLLPTSVRGNGRVSLVLYRNGRAYNTKTTTRTNSIIVSVALVNGTTIKKGEFIEIHLRSIRKPLDNETKMCGYWDSNASNGSGMSDMNWSTSGCFFNSSKDNHSLDLCICNHLTHFGMFLMPKIGDKGLGTANEIALSIISTVGCCFSLVGLTIISLTGVFFKSWRKEFRHKIWLHLSASLTIQIISFFLIASNNFSGDPSYFCIAIGITLHYSVLSSFSWMVVAAAMSYERLVTVYQYRRHSHRLIKASIFCWGFPCIIIGTLLAVDIRNYEFKDSDVNKYCYPTNYGFWLTVFLPVLIAIIINTIFFIVIVFFSFGRRLNIQSTRRNDEIHCINVCVILTFLFGIPFVIGLLPEVAFTAYAFCMTASLQGFILFLYIIAYNEQTTNLWLECLKIKQRGKINVTVSSSGRTRINDLKEETREGIHFVKFYNE